MPVFVASSGGIKNGETFNLGLSSHVRLTLMGDNIFGAVYNHIQKLIQSAEPFKQTALQKMKQAIHVHATIKTQVYKSRGSIWGLFTIDIFNQLKLVILRNIYYFKL